MYSTPTRVSFEVSKILSYPRIPKIDQPLGSHTKGYQGYQRIPRIPKDTKNIILPKDTNVLWYEIKLWLKKKEKLSVIKFFYWGIINQAILFLFNNSYYSAANSQS